MMTEESLSLPTSPDQANAEREQRIRERAYELWHADGEPEGRSEEYWHRSGGAKEYYSQPVQVTQHLVYSGERATSGSY
jgi:hypothetical protein